MRNLSIGMKLAICFALIVGIFVSVAIIEYRANREVDARMAEYIHWNDVALGLSEQVSRSTIQLVNAMFVYRMDDSAENLARLDALLVDSQSGILSWYESLRGDDIALLYDAVSGASESFLRRSPEETLSQLERAVAVVAGREDLGSRAVGGQSASTPVGPAVTYVDGLYHGEYTHVDGHGWRPFVNFVIDGGRITGSHFDYVNPDGVLKTDDESYAALMDRLHGLTPRRYVTGMSSQFLRRQAAGIDGVTGATESVHEFNELAERMLVQAEVGDTAPVVLPMNAPYGASESEPGPDGLLAEVAVHYKDGRIVGVDFTAEDAEGQVREITNPRTIERLTEAVVATQRADGVLRIGSADVRTRFVTLVEQAMAMRVEAGPPPVTAEIPDWLARATAGVAQVSYTDGLYHGEYSHVDGHDWRPFLNINIEGGRIVSALLDYIDPDGVLKSEDESYEALMDRLHGMTPKRYARGLNSQLVASQTAGVDGVTGATHSSHEFNELSALLLDRARSGNNEPVVLPMNGGYHASESEAGDDGLLWEIAIEYVDDEIESVDVSAEDIEGQIREIADQASVAQLTTALMAAGDPGAVGRAGDTAVRERFLALAEQAIAIRRQVTPDPPVTAEIPDWVGPVTAPGEGDGGADGSVAGAAAEQPREGG